MVGLAPGDIRQAIIRAQRSVKGVTLLLRTGILPIGAERMCKSILQLADQGLFRVQAAQQLLAGGSPVNTAVLLTGTGNALDPLKRRALLCQPLEHQVDGLQPHGYRGVDLPLGLVDEDTFLDAILEEVGVEVDFGFVHDLQAGRYDDCFGWLARSNEEHMSTPLSCWVERSKPR
jgi:hypothetical protein